MNQTLSVLFSNFGVTDLIDIFIVSFLLYQVWGFISSTRAAQLAKGLLVIFAVYFASDFFHLYVINWILEKILSVGLIAVVVVFQPELRRGLEKLGRGKLSFKSFSMDAESVSAQVNIIVRAIDYFSRKKEGAIIVIERETALQDVSDTGTRMDCRLSEEIIENIFYKGSPLHDGAMILRGDRILAAGCVLPLTGNPNLSKDLGTRHRAGIGITEVSDSIALIVSEETGIISLAVDGKLQRFLDLKTVEKYLLNMYLEKAEENRTPVQRVTDFLKGKTDGEI